MNTCDFLKAIAAGAVALVAGTCGAVAQVKGLSVGSYSNDVVTLYFSGLGGTPHKIAMARGSRDAGSARDEWESIEIVGETPDPYGGEFTYTIPKGDYRYARFFLLNPSLPFAKCLAMVRSENKSHWVDTGVQARSGVRADFDMTLKLIADDTVLGAREGNTRFFLYHAYYKDSKPRLCQQLGGWVAPTEAQFHDYGWRYTSLISEILPTSRALYQSSLTPSESATLSQSYTLNKNLYLFACNLDGTAKQFADVLLVRGKIWMDGTLVRDFIPVEANDGKGALFDLVTRGVFNDGNSSGLTKGVEIEAPVEVYTTATSTSTIELPQEGTLIERRDFLNDAPETVNYLSLPYDCDAPRTIVVRFKALSAGANTERMLLVLVTEDSALKLFMLDEDNMLGSQEVTPDTWHTLTIEGSRTRLDCYLDETKLVESDNCDGIAALATLEGVVFGDGNDETEEHIRFASIEVRSAAGAGEGRLAAGTKTGMTGEWTFPVDNPLRANRGHNLEKIAMVSSNEFQGQSSTDGVVARDAKIYTQKYSGFRCRHGLEVNSDYSVVMDVRVPSSSANGLHGVFMANTFGITDCNLFFRKNADSEVMDAWVESGTYIPTTARHGEWLRVVLTYANDGNKTLYINGVPIDARPWLDSKINGPYCYFCMDNTGEDNDIDISYATIYDRVLTAAEVAEFHGRATAHTSPAGEVIITTPLVGQWERHSGALVSCIAGVGDLTAQADGGYTWTQATAPAGMTVVVDFKPPYQQTQSGVILANANGVATGLYGTAGGLNGCLATSTTSSIFATGADETGTATWGGSTYESLVRGQEQRVVITWDAQGHVRYYVNGQLLSQQDPTAADTAAQPTATMTFLSGLGRYTSRLSVYNDALTPLEVASLGGFKKVTLPLGTIILLR